MARQSIRGLRRTELIEAVIASIHEIGFAALTVNDIAKRAQTSTGSIHYYFGSKEALLEATMRRLLSVLKEATLQRLADKTSPAERIEAIVSANFDDALYTQQHCSVWNQFWASAPYTPSLKRLQRVNRSRVQSNLMRDLKQLVQADRAKDATSSIQAYMDGVWINSAQFGGVLDAPAAQRNASRFVGTLLDQLSDN